MIDFNDYIRQKVSNGSVVLKYHLYCDNCGCSRGYQKKGNDKRLCKSCSSKREHTSEEREKISKGVRKYYDSLHGHKEILMETPKQEKRKHTRSLESRWKTVRRDSKSKDKKYPENSRYDFTDDELKMFLQQPCHYCGFPADGLDRINNDLGHCKTNCVPCCTLCNLTRGNRYTVEEFKLVGLAIKTIKEKRN